MQEKWNRLRTLVAALFALGGPGIADGASTQYADVPLPYVQNGIYYLSGGVWESGIVKLQEEASKYPLELVFNFESVRGEEGGRSVVGDVVVIRDSAGSKVLGTVTNGPLFLVKLPPGIYDVTVTHRGRRYERRAVVDPEKHERIVFDGGPDS